MEKEKKILGRKAEYKRELFEDHKKNYNVIKGIFAGLLIMKRHIPEAIRKMQSDKATRSDRISMELLEAPGD